MPRYYFHLHNGIGDAEDGEGTELPNLDAARKFAIESARSILSEEAKEGLIDLASSIDVADEHGNILLTLSFREAVELRGE